MKKQIPKTQVLFKTQILLDNNPNNVKLETTHYLMFPEANRAIQAYRYLSSYFGGGGKEYYRASLTPIKGRIYFEKIDASANVSQQILHTIKSISFKEYIQVNGELVYWVLNDERLTLPRKVSSLVKLLRKVT